MNVEQQRSQEQASFTVFVYFYLLFLSILECIAVASLAPQGILLNSIPIVQVVFGIVGLVFVLSRNKLERTRQLAEKHSLWGINAIAKALLTLSLLFSALGMMHLYLYMMELRTEERLANSAPYRAIETELALLRSEKERLESTMNDVSGSLIELENKHSHLETQRTNILSSIATNSLRQTVFKNGQKATVQQLVGNCLGRNSFYEKKYCSTLNQLQTEQQSLSVSLDKAKRLAILKEKILGAQKRLFETEGNGADIQKYDSLFYFISEIFFLSPFGAVVLVGCIMITFMLGTGYVLPAIIPHVELPIPQKKVGSIESEPDSTKSWFSRIWNRRTQSQLPVQAQSQSAQLEPEPTSFGFKFVSDENSPQSNSKAPKSKRNEALQLLAQGQTVAKVAQNLGISKTTVYRYKKQNNA